MMSEFDQQSHKALIIRELTVELKSVPFKDKETLAILFHKIDKALTDICGERSPQIKFLKRIHIIPTDENASEKVWTETWYSGLNEVITLFNAVLAQLDETTEEELLEIPHVEEDPVVEAPAEELENDLENQELSPPRETNPTPQNQSFHKNQAGQAKEGDEEESDEEEDLHPDLQKMEEVVEKVNVKVTEFIEQSKVFSKKAQDKSTEIIKNLAERFRKK